MLFHSLAFAVFFPIVYALYLVLPHKLQNRMLLAASYVFYGWWDWRYLSLLLISTCVDYFCGLGLDKVSDKGQRKVFVTISICTNVLLLCIFKYFDFFSENFASLMAGVGLKVQPYYLDLVLPIGISFYTFQTMSYTIDVYRKKVPAARNWFDFALYVSFFPQLIAGPIERGTRLLPQILQPRTVTLTKVSRGVYIFIWGLFLKVFIADNLANIVDPVFNSSAPYDGSSVLLAVYAFSFQIYCDFAGYSFMAIGLAMVMGIELMENFRRPYFSKNISVFWRRWHISLSSWFRDYVFAPFYIYVGKLGMLSKLPIRRRHDVAFFITLMVTEFMLGLWHGAAWNFAFFGIYHGLVIWAYYYLKNYWDRMNPFIQIFLTYHIACGGWLVFRATSFEQAVDMAYAVLYNFDVFARPELLTTGLVILGYVSILLIIQIFQDLKQDTYVIFRLPVFFRCVFAAFLISLVMVLGDFSERSFIYFQF